MEGKITLNRSSGNRDLGLKFPSISSPQFRTMKVNSPVSDLAVNLGELSTKHDENTPRRKLSLCSTGTPTPFASLKPRFFASQFSEDDGCCMDSPSPVDTDSPFLLERFGKPDSLQKQDQYEDIPSQAFKRFQSMPVPFCGFDPSPPNTNTESRLSDRLLNRISSPPHHITSDASPALTLGSKKSHLSSSSPLKRSPLTPLFDSNVTSPYKCSEDENSQDSGVCLESKDSAFKFPIAPAPRSQRMLYDESRSPLRYSPVAKNAPRTFKGVSQTLTAGVFKSSPLKGPRSRCASLDSDDGIDILDMLDFEEESHEAPAGLDSLLHSKVLNTENQPCKKVSPPKSSQGSGDQPTPKLSAARIWCTENQENIKPTKGIRRGLFRSPSAPRLFQHKAHTMHAPSSTSTLSPLCASPLFQRQTSTTQKRNEPCSSDDWTPRVSKRRKSVTDECLETKSKPASTLQIPKPELHRCQSMSEEMIKSALNRQASCPDLVGDMSRPYSLPLCKSKHDDLKGITPDTLAAVLRGEYDHIVEKCVIIDSRYPYEFEGGHIQGAKNLYLKSQVLDEFFTKSDHKLTRDPTKRTIIVFHCEFSSERGPKMSRFLRSQDRTINKDLYPFLNYPEIYLLEEGYKRFFEEQKTHCEPQTYKPMLHAGHEDDLKHFRAKSKSWAGGERGGRGFRSLRSGLKF